MKINECRADSEHVSVPDSATVVMEPYLDRAGHNRVLRVRNSPSDAVEAITNGGRFPLRTLIVCFTIWLIATQAMIFDQLKFNERAHLLEQGVRSFSAPQAVVPNEPPSNLPSGVNLQRL
jgi:hypothetical protein